MKRPWRSRRSRRSRRAGGGPRRADAGPAAAPRRAGRSAGRGRRRPGARRPSRSSDRPRPTTGRSSRAAPTRRGPRRARGPGRVCASSSATRGWSSMTRTRSARRPGFIARLARLSGARDRARHSLADRVGSARRAGRAPGDRGESISLRESGGSPRSARRAPGRSRAAVPPGRRSSSRSASPRRPRRPAGPPRPSAGSRGRRPAAVPAAPPSRRFERSPARRSGSPCRGRGAVLGRRPRSPSASAESPAWHPEHKARSAPPRSTELSEMEANAPKWSASVRPRRPFFRARNLKCPTVGPPRRTEGATDMDEPDRDEAPGESADPRERDRAAPRRRLSSAGSFRGRRPFRISVARPRAGRAGDRCSRWAVAALARRAEELPGGGAGLRRRVRQPLHRLARGARAGDALSPAGALRDPPGAHLRPAPVGRESASSASRRRRA